MRFTSVQPPKVATISEWANKTYDQKDDRSEASSFDYMKECSAQLARARLISELPAPDNLPKGYNISEKPWARGDQLPTVLYNADVVDPRGGVVRKAMTLHLANGKIASIEPTTEEDITADFYIGRTKVRKVDCSGMYLCPGLIDCHVHLMSVHGGKTLHESFGFPHEVAIMRSAGTMRGILSNGFTTVRDTGGASTAHASATAEWLIPGPRIFQCGRMISQTGGHGDHTEIWPQSGSASGCCSGQGEGTSNLARLADGVDECLKATRDNMRKGANHIKVCTSGGLGSETDKLDGIQYTIDGLKAITSTCENMGGTLVTSHCYTAAGIRHAVAGGVKGIEHGNLLDASTAQLMAEKGVFLTPALALHTFVTIPPYSNFETEAGLAKNRLVKDAGVKAIQIAEKAGVTVCYGTDTTGPTLVMQTYEFVVRGDILPSPVVLRHATINGAKQLGMTGLLGELIEGAYADMLLLKTNPLEDIASLDKVKTNQLCVIKDGRVVKSKLAGLPVEVAVEW